MSEKKALPSSDINGWLILDKPYQMSSARAVAIVKRLLGVSKIGHAGTLDPLATGVLPLAIGKATRTIAFTMDGQKEYEFEITFGQSRTTDDLEGDVLEESSFLPTKEDIEKVLPFFQGKIKQRPPIFSALKVEGKRAYDLARKGKEVELLSRDIEIFDLTLLAQTETNKFSFKTTCSKGTYVRALARDIAEKVGSKGFVSALRRTKCHTFSIQDAILLEILEQKVHNNNCLDLILPVRTALTDILELALTETELNELSFGRAFPSRFQNLEEGTVYQATFNGQLIALVTQKEDMILPYKVFI